MALAAGELTEEGAKVIDVAIKYGYESPDSFSKAFTRFHGVTPSMVQKNSAMLKSFVPLKIDLSLKGGYTMEYKLIKKESFTVIGVMKRFLYDGAKNVIPDFWKEHFEKGNGKYVCGMFGINMDESMGNSEFDYMIADVNVKIFSEWLPGIKEYEFAAGYCIEMYDDAGKYPEGIADKDYYAEIWIPVKRK